MASCKVLHGSYKTDKGTFTAGQTVEVSDEEAKRLTELGILGPSDGAEATQVPLAHAESPVALPVEEPTPEPLPEEPVAEEADPEATPHSHSRKKGKHS
jgi:hypothetical protein